jgi:replicative DNA helicase
MNSALHSPEAERALLGACLSDPSILPELAHTIRPEDFAEGLHGDVWAAFQSLHAGRRPVDHLTVSEELKARGQLAAVGGPAALMALDEAAPLTSNAAECARTVREYATRRAIVKIAREAAGNGASLQKDASGVALAAANAFASLAAAGARELQTMEVAMGEMLDDLQAIARGEKQPAIRTGIDVWDDALGGLPMEKLTCIGAYPSVGKTAVMVRMMANIAQAGVPVGVFSLEDPKAALLRRIVSRVSGVPVRRMATERLPEFLMESVGSAAERIYPMLRNILVEDRSGMTASQVAAIARQMVVQRGCKVIFVDHAGELKLDSKAERHDLRLEEAIHQLRDVAKDLKVAVVLLAHFHRPKGGTDKDEPRNMRPTSAMWKNSGAFEQAARVAVGLWLDKDIPGGIVGTVLKQTEGQKDLDFWMPLHAPSGLVESMGGKACDGRGYDEDRIQEGNGDD